MRMPPTEYAGVRSRGFTLLEALVAMAILAVALLAAMRVAAQGSEDASTLRTRQLAGWVASNILSEHAVRGDWLPVGVSTGSERQGGDEFAWRKEISATPNPAFRRVDVVVYAPPGRLQVATRASGMLVRSAGDGR